MLTQETVNRFYEALDNLKDAFDQYTYLTDQKESPDAEKVVSGIIGNIASVINGNLKPAIDAMTVKG